MNDQTDNGRDRKDSSSSRTSEVSIYVVKKMTAGAEGEAEEASFSVGVNGHTHLVSGNRAEALATVGEILDSLD